MASPTSLLGDVRGFARDYPRDRLPQGLLWDVIDYIPALLDAQLTSRGGWDYASAALPAVIEGGIYAPFRSGPRLLLNTNGNVYQVAIPGGAVTNQGASPSVVQNPVMLMDQVISPNAAGVLPKVYTAPAAGGLITIADAGAGAAMGRYATVYKNRVLISGAAPNDGRIYFSPPGTALTAWDAAAWQGTSLPLTGIGALRSTILAFHAGSVERIRGTKPPDTAASDVGDLILESLFDRAGCGDARSIAYWNDNCLFADERGIHMTDGAVVRNLIAQGGLSTFWRSLYRDRTSLAAETYLDYYIITVVTTAGDAITLICDLNRRTWFRFANVRASCYIRSVGVQEEVYFGVGINNRLAGISPCFFPIRDDIAMDDNGQAVLPVFETRWHRLGDEGRKRIRFAYLSYDMRSTPANPAPVLPEALDFGYVLSPELQVYTSSGQLPSTTTYDRLRLPIGADPYGIAFQVKQLLPSTVTRIYDQQVEAEAEEKSRRS
jgi:hypothetical protein